MGLAPGTMYVFENYVCFRATLGGDKVRGTAHQCSLRDTCLTYEQHVIPVVEIAQVRQQALLGLINNSMVITLKNGVEVCSFREIRVLCLLTKCT